MSQSTASVKQSVAYYWKPAAIVTGLVAISTIAYNVTAIRQYFNPNSPDLVASVSANDFKMPTSFWEQLEIGSVEGAGLVTKYSPLESIITVSIRNAGNLPARDVRLKLETEGIAKIKWDKEESEPIEFESILRLGEFPLEKSAEVTIWSTSAPLTLTVLHSTGKEVYLLYRETPPPLWFWGFMIGLPLVLVALSFREKAQDAKNANAEVVRLREEVFARQQTDLDDRNAEFQNKMNKLDEELRKSLARLSLSFAGNQPCVTEISTTNAPVSSAQPVRTPARNNVLRSRKAIANPYGFPPDRSL